MRSTSNIVENTEICKFENLKKLWKYPDKFPENQIISYLTSTPILL